MSKVETYIKEHTRSYSNERRVSVGRAIYWEKQPWLTPDDAGEVAKIAREDAIEEVCEYIKNNYEDIGLEYIRGYEAEGIIENLKEALL